MRQLITAIVLGMVLALPLSLAAEEFAPNYPDYEQMVAEVYRLAEEYPSLVAIEIFGKSVEDRDLLAVHIYRRDGQKRPAAMVAGNIHGNEMIGNRMAMAVAWRLVRDAESDPWVKGLLDRMDFWILPCLNPDGYVKTVELFKQGDLKGHRKNAHEVDLNRNFLLPEPRTLKINWAGSPKKDNANYYGPYPGSEPETGAVKSFMDSHAIFASVNYHSVQGVIFPARCTGKQRKATRDHHALGRAYSRNQPKVNYLYILWPNWIDTFTGEMEDLQYQFYGTLALDIELGRAGRNRAAARRELGGKIGPSKAAVYGSGFWTFNPINLDFWIQNDRDATLHAIEKAFELTGGIPAPIDKR